MEKNTSPIVTQVQFPFLRGKKKCAHPGEKLTPESGAPPPPLPFPDRFKQSGTGVFGSSSS